MKGPIPLEYVYYTKEGKIKAIDIPLCFFVILLFPIVIIAVIFELIKYMFVDTYLITKEQYYLQKAKELSERK